MYVLSRMLLIATTLLALYCLAILAALTWPWSGWLLAIAAFACATNNGRRRLTTLGSARWADEDDLRRAGMIGAEQGLIVGWLPMRGDLFSRLRKLFSRRISAKEICTEFWGPRVRRRGYLVRLAQAVHTVVFAATGGGKGVSCIIPFLLTCPDSCVVIDFKGENALRTARHRAKKFGHRIVLLDPFKMVTQTPDCLNPLDFIDKNSPTALDDCNDLAKALIVRTGEEREPHWNDSAESWLSALIATVVHHG